MDWLLDAIWQKISGGVSSTVTTLFAPFQWLIDWSPMVGHLVLFVAFLMVCSFIARFLPDKLKLWLGGIVIVVGAFIAGETYRFKRTLDETKAAKKKVKR